MTEYELADLVASTISNSLIIAPILISIASAYLVVAWVVGSKLDRSQVILINVLFVGFTSIFGLSWARRIQIAISYQEELLKANPDRMAEIGEWLLPGVALFGILIITACLKFMWDIRHPKTK